MKEPKTFSHCRFCPSKKLQVAGEIIVLVHCASWESFVNSTHHEANEPWFGASVCPQPSQPNPPNSAALVLNFCSYTISGPSTARPLPDWLARRRKRSEKYDPETLNNFELLQEFEFEEGLSYSSAQSSAWHGETLTPSKQRAIAFV